MKYLLDTGIFLWALDAPHRLNEQARKLLAPPLSELYLSAVSSWEIAIKFAIGTLRLAKPPAEFVVAGLNALSIRSLQVNNEHAFAAGSLPAHHGDPFDRMLIAQALVEDMTLLTADRTIQKYQLQTLFCGR